MEQGTANYVNRSEKRGVLRCSVKDEAEAAWTYRRYENRTKYGHPEGKEQP